MGFKPNRKVYELIFESDDLAGLEVRARSISTGGMLEIDKLSSEARGGAGQVSRELGLLIEKFAPLLVSWNVEEDDGTPVPATLDGLLVQDPGFVLDVISAWAKAVAGVDPTSQPESTGGGTSPVPPLPMETLSLSQVS